MGILISVLAIAAILLVIFWYKYCELQAYSASIIVLILAIIVFAYYLYKLSIGDVTITPKENNNSSVLLALLPLVLLGFLRKK